MIYAETERLVLRSWREADLLPFVAMNMDGEVMKYFPALLTAEQTEAFYHRIQDEFDTKGFGLYAVELKATGEFVGYVGLHEIGFSAYFTPGIEIGWRLASTHHKRGYAPEAATAVLSLARDMGIKSLHSFTALQNSPSEKVMQKIGMRMAGYFDHPNVAADSPLYRHVRYTIDL